MATFLNTQRRVAIRLIVGLMVGLFTLATHPAHALSGNITVHDPSMIKSGNCYYTFSTGDSAFNRGNIQIRRSCDLINGWTRIGTIFNTIPSWIPGAIGSTPPNLWAPDINFINGRWYLYYAASTFGSNRSAIGLATATNIEGPWTDNGEVFRSTTSNNYNAIDPEIAWTITNGQRAEQWLVFGSWWDGIKMRRLDPATGKLSSADTRLYSLASRGGGAIEAPSIAWRNGFYYLFVSFDRCCQGSNSTYNIRVGRATSITGPYIDRNGVNMLNGGGTQLLASSGNVRGPGGQDVMLDSSTYRMIYHYYDSNAGGRPTMAISNLSWTSDNWPVVGPRL